MAEICRCNWRLAFNIGTKPSGLWPHRKKTSEPKRNDSLPHKAPTPVSSEGTADVIASSWVLLAPDICCACTTCISGSCLSNTLLKLLCLHCLQERPVLLPLLHCSRKLDLLDIPLIFAFSVLPADAGAPVVLFPLHSSKELNLHIMQI
jgi:hypothetical protein